MNVGRWSALLIFAAGLGGALWRSQPPNPAQILLSAPLPTVSAAPAAFSSANLPVAAPSAHAASLAELADGKVVAAWFAGAREGAADVAIWMASLEQGQWSQPRAILTREQLATSTLSHIRKLGNPVLFADGQHLHLWVTAASIGGWAGSALHYTRSDDGGRHWTVARRLVSSPFFNYGTLVRSPPLTLTSGGFGLPVYHEFLAKHGEWLHLDATSRPLRKSRLPSENAELQPAVAALDQQRLLALLRDAGPAPGRVQVATSDDAGVRWQHQAPLNIGNPNSSLALLRLHDGRLLLAGNPSSGRNILELWLSTDQGRHWRKIRELENANDDSAEFSYPALLQARDGRIHLAYTWRRQAIRHASFDASWLENKR